MDAIDIATHYGCDLTTNPGHYCERQPVAWFALSAEPPNGWSHEMRASLGVYCTLEHALAERTPTLDQAWATASEIERPSCDRVLLDAWERVLDNYPNPVPIVQPATAEGGAATNSP